MAITHVNTEAATQANTGTGSITVTKPASTANGDIMVAMILGNDTSMSLSGWTSHIAQSATATGSLFRLTILYRYVDGTEGAGPYTFTGGSGGPIGIVLSAYRGVASSSPLSIGSRSDSAGPSGEPYVNPTLNVTGSGRVIAIRGCRFSGAGQTAVTFSGFDADATYRHARAISSGGSTQYALGVYDYNTQRNNGDSVSASSSHNGGTNETDNLSATFGLKMEGTPATGTLGMTTPAVTSNFAGERQIPTGSMAATIPAVSSTFAGVASPPEGTLGPMQIPAIYAELAGQLVYGTVGPMQIPAVSSEMTATSIGGGFTLTLPAIGSEFAGAVNPIGDFASFTPLVVTEFIAESRSFGEHVIAVEADHRAFLVTDEDNGLIPIKRSKVTQQ